MKETGTVKILLAKGLTEIPALRVGQFWAAHRVPDTENAFNVTHIATGRAFVTYIKVRHACRLVGVLDTLMPTTEYQNCETIWNRWPTKLQQAFVKMSYTC